MRVGRQHLAHRQEHALLVVADDPRGAGREAQLSRAAGDVGVDQANLLLVRSRLRIGDQLLQMLTGYFGAVLLEHLVEAPELHERDRRGSVLR